MKPEDSLFAAVERRKEEVRKEMPGNSPSSTAPRAAGVTSDGMSGQPGAHNSAGVAALITKAGSVKYLSHFYSGSLSSGVNLLLQSSPFPSIGPCSCNSGSPTW
ncbi:MAG: hypothetical protein OEY64_13145, partial [Nitrospinota bacterium]|nr:hypothetical protein [Nitrospinota bacterium]